jgi:hypothetical protein
LTTTTTDKSVQILCRTTGTTSLINGYLAGYNHSATQLWIRRYLSGAASTIGTFSASISANDTLRLTCTGDSIVLAHNGTDKITVTNSEVTAAGAAAIGIRTGGSITAWEAGQ